jgi:hypothetical protein
MQIKCTSCGAAQELAPNNQCSFCGSTVETEKAQENYNYSTSGELGNLMMMAETAIDATNWEEALSFYNQALTKDITNSDAWLGKGIAIVYTSKIGDIKTTEAIAYWKNAIKHASNSEAMGKRVAKEINTVVNSFYPTMENHYKQFHNLDDSYQELVSRFVILENAQDYATQLDPENINYYETGFNLCKRVIDLPRNYASAANSVAFAEGVAGQFSSNKYSRQSAARNSREKMAEANRRLEEISRASKIIEKIRQKYALTIEKLDPNHAFLKELDQEIKNKVRAKKEAEKTNYQTYATIIIAGILYLIIMPLELKINSVLLFIIVIAISMILGVKIGGNFYEQKNK